MFNLNSIPGELLFICQCCNKTANTKPLLGCSCGNRLFKVARYMKLIDNPLTPYHTDEDEDVDDEELCSNISP